MNLILTRQQFNSIGTSLLAFVKIINETKDFVEIKTDRFTAKLIEKNSVAAP